MKKQTNEVTIPTETLMNRIYVIRGVKVMLDADLAELYGVETKVMNQSVKRNSKRFPDDFMFQLSTQEFEILKSQFVTSSQSNWSQIVTSSRKHRGDKYLPYAFTEQGVAMLSGILNSDRAITVNIQIMRIFTNMRKLLMDNTELRIAIEEIEQLYKDQINHLQQEVNYLRGIVNSLTKSN
jgi:hypothetical protein